MAAEEIPWGREQLIYRLLDNPLLLDGPTDKHGNTALMLACDCGQKEEVDLLLSCAANVNIESADGHTALMYASSKGYTDILNCLLSEGAKPDHQNKNGETGMMWASMHGRKDVVELLLSVGANPNLQDENGATAMMDASTWGQKDVVEILLKKVDIDHQDKNGATALMKASFRGEKEVVELLLSAKPDTSLKNKDGKTARMLASENGHKAVVDLLQSQPSPPTPFYDEEVVKHLKCLMDEACKAGRVEIVQQLLCENPFLLNANLTGFGTTPLMVASRWIRKDVAKVLLSANVDVDCQTSGLGHTALMEASITGSTDVMELLLAAKANVNLQCKEGCTALIMASERGHNKVVELLLSAKANPNLKTHNGRTALLEACGNREMVEVLVSAKPDPDLQDEGGYTALMKASWLGDKDTVKLLLSLNPDISLKNNDKKTALMLASENCHWCIANLLESYSPSSPSSSCSSSSSFPPVQNQNQSNPRNFDELEKKLKRLEEENNTLKERLSRVENEKEIMTKDFQQAQAENGRLKNQILELQASLRERSDPSEIDDLVFRLEKVGEEILAIRYQLADHVIEEERAKKQSQTILEGLLEKNQKGESIQRELDIMKDVRERREEKKKDLDGKLRRNLQTEKLLISLIEGKLRQKEKAGQMKLEHERLVAEKVIEIAKLDNRIKHELPLDCTRPSFSQPFPVSFSMSHHSASFRPTYCGEGLFSLPKEHLENYEKYIEFERQEKKVVGSVRPGPFAMGGFRYAYFGMISEGLSLGGKREIGGEPVVMKHAMDIYENHEEGAGGELRELRECTVAHLLGRRVIGEFNKRGVRGCGEVVMVGCEVLEWANPMLEGYPRKYWSVEPYLPAKFIKFNNNDGKGQDENYPLAQALSHFSCYLFDGNLIMLDIQGCVQGDNLVLTDPAFSTPSGKGFGEGNLKDAISNFFQEHRCSWICHALMGEGAKKNLTK